MPQDQFAQLLELLEGKVRSQRCLEALFALDSNADIRLHNHANVVATVADSRNALASCVVLQGFAYFSLLRWGASADAHAWRLNRCVEEGVSCLLVVKDGVEGLAVND